MKFLCVECDELMAFAERQLPGDGTLAAIFACGACGREMALLTNPMETQFVSTMGVKIGGREVPAQPMEVVRTSVDGGRDGAFRDPVAEGPPPTEGERTLTGEGADAGDEAVASPGPVAWSPEALERLERVPNFVRGMVKRIYTDYARERELGRITPEIMDRARSDLGLEGM